MTATRPWKERSLDELVTITLDRMKGLLLDPLPDPQFAIDLGMARSIAERITVTPASRADTCRTLAALAVLLGTQATCALGITEQQAAASHERPIIGMVAGLPNQGAYTLMRVSNVIGIVAGLLNDET